MEKTRAEPYYGIGAAFRVTERLRIRLDGDRARARTGFDEQFEVGLFSAGIGYRF